MDKSFEYGGIMIQHCVDSECPMVLPSVSLWEGYAAEGALW